MRTLINTLPEIPKLREHSRDLDLEKDYDLIFEVNNELNNYLRATKACAGISAIQFGEPINLFLFKNKNKTSTSVINPTIYSESNDKSIDDEGCMSFPKMYCRVPRSNVISVSYSTIYVNGNISNLPQHYLRNMNARVFKHEYDHLMGIEMFDRALAFPKMFKHDNADLIYATKIEDEIDYFIQNENKLFYSGKDVNPEIEKEIIGIRFR